VKRILDDIERMKALDKGDMIGKVLAFPRHCRDMMSRMRDTALAPARPKNMVFLGLGGSAIGGDLARALLKDKLKIPAVVCRDYVLPRFVGKDSLVLAASYSGNTGETLEAYGEARERGARIIAFSSGGALMERALVDNTPHVLFPRGLPPRAALGYSFTAQLLALEQLGLAHGSSKDLEEALALVEDLRDAWGPGVPAQENAAKRLALRLIDRVPLIYGTRELYSIVAYRWRCQLNENAKILAFSNGFPELNHNEVVPLGEGFGRDRGFILVVLKDHTRGKGLDGVTKITSWYLKDKVEMLEFEAKGKSPLARMMWHTVLGDLASVYLAFARGMDPTPVGPIDRIKSRMRKRGEGK
jgi:glucose/mannose-6-phosphate isomerase